MCDLSWAGQGSKSAGRFSRAVLGTEIQKWGQQGALGRFENPLSNPALALADLVGHFRSRNLSFCPVI